MSFTLHWRVDNVTLAYSLGRIDTDHGRWHGDTVEESWGYRDSEGDHACMEESVAEVDPMGNCTDCSKTCSC